MSGCEWSLYVEQKYSGERREFCYGKFGEADFIDHYRTNAEQRQAVRSLIAETLKVRINEVHLTTGLEPYIMVDNLPDAERLKEIAKAIWQVYNVRKAAELCYSK